MLFLFVCIVLGKLTISNQTPFSSEITTDQDTWIKLPEYCHVRFNNTVKEASSFVDGKFYLTSKVTIYKPTRKMFEYEYDIEKGIKIYNSENEFITDSSNYPDFSAQIIGVTIPGFLIALLFKFYA